MWAGNEDLIPLYVPVDRHILKFNTLYSSAYELYRNKYKGRGKYEMRLACILRDLFHVSVSHRKYARLSGGDGCRVQEDILEGCQRTLFRSMV